MTLPFTVLVAVALLGCVESLPEPPQLLERLAPYQEGPNVDVSLEEVADTVLDEGGKRQLATVLAGAEVVVEQVTDGIGLPDPGTTSVDLGTNPREAVRILGGRFFVDLIAEGTHICPGHDPGVAVPNRDINGTLSFNARITESGFQGAFWGEFDTCRFRHDGIDLGFESNSVVVDGDVAVVFLDPLGFDVERDYLFVFDGLAVLNDVLVLDGPFDFLVQQEVGVLVRVPTPDGGQVFLFQPLNNPNVLELRTLSETWQCDLSLQRCLSTDGTQATW